jgi:hypothetical protein
MMLSMPSPSQRMSKFDNYDRNSPFTEILLELASEDSNDQFFGGKTINAYWRSMLLTLTTRAILIFTKHSVTQGITRPQAPPQ